MKQVIDICQRHHIAMLATYAIPDDEQPKLRCTTALLTKDYAPPQEYLTAYHHIIDGLSSNPMIITENGDGKIIEMTTVLG